MDKPTIGRIVHYTSGEGQVRPAMIVRVFNEDPGTCNLQVFLDGANDERHSDLWPDSTSELGLVWKTSVTRGEPGEPGTWSWPPREPVAPAPTIDPPAPELPTEPVSVPPTAAYLDQPFEEETPAAPAPAPTVEPEAEPEEK